MSLIFGSDKGIFSFRRLVKYKFSRKYNEAITKQRQLIATIGHEDVYSGLLDRIRDNPVISSQLDAAINDFIIKLKQYFDLLRKRGLAPSGGEVIIK
jgi:hypothetical protein